MPPKLRPTLSYLFVGLFFMVGIVETVYMIVSKTNPLLRTEPEKVAAPNYAPPSIASSSAFLAQEKIDHLHRSLSLQTLNTYSYANLTLATQGVVSAASYLKPEEGGVFSFTVSIPETGQEQTFVLNDQEVLAAQVKLSWPTGQYQVPLGYLQPGDTVIVHRFLNLLDSENNWLYHLNISKLNPVD